MAGSSAIEWTDATWNPVTGCTRVSPGCAHCYIERTPPFRMAGRRFEVVDGEATTGVTLHPDRLEQPLRWRKPRMIFVNSMSDLFHDEIPDEFIARVYAVMYQAPQHTFQVLTKRPERARMVGTPEFIELVQQAGDALFDDPDDQYVQAGPWPPANVWLGVSIENARYTWRAEVLKEIPAAVRFVSAEPLLGSLFYRGDSQEQRVAVYKRYGLEAGINRDLNVNCGRAPLELTGIDWVIVGGESGPGARPMHPDWARELRDACLAPCPDCRGPSITHLVGACERRPAFFFKQWGGATPKSGGRELDGRTWDEMPEPRT